MLRIFCVLAAFFAPGLAWAGAFMQAPEHGQVIAELAFTEARLAYDAFGRGGVIPAWRKFELSTYAEYGLSESVTLIGDPSWFTFRAKPPGVSRTRPGVTEAGARMKILETGDNIFSAQATMRYAPAGRSAAEFSDMRERAQVDVRLLFGRKMEVIGLGGYIDFQIGFRTRATFGHQIRLDATYAVRPFARATLMLQTFTAINPGRIGDRFMLSQKMKASVVYDITETVSAQVGGLLALRGVNSAAERGIVSALWWKF
ncbi:MAG TPA: hypothetical protein PKA55_11245 [Rhodoblastus sp.]|nr:hypothetical protein [Rhodoblastus sp.]